jgi:hypothetical protein
MSERKKIVLVFEGVAFAVGLLLVALGTYFMAIEAIKKRSGPQ